MASRRRYAGAWFLLLLCVAQTASAAPSAAERDTARSLMDDGDRMLTSGKLREALERYRAAHAIMHVPTTGIELARVQARLGLLVEARATAMEVLNLPRSEADEQSEPAVFQQARASAVLLVRELEPRVPSLQAKVTPADQSFQLSVDGVKLPDEARNVPFRTNPGAHSVSVEAPGFAAEQREIVLEEGQALTLALRLARLQPSAATAQPAERSAPALSLRSDDVLDARAAGQARGIVGLALGAAGLITGGVTGLVALVQTRQEQHNCPDNHCDVSRASALGTANTYANVANVSFAVGVLGFAYGAYELLTLPSPVAADTRARVEVGVGSIQLHVPL
jgi:hypothetical protein